MHRAFIVVALLAAGGTASAQEDFGPIKLKPGRIAGTRDGGALAPAC